MDVFEFLRLNAQESSQQLLKQTRLERSSGDGEDSSVTQLQDAACAKQDEGRFVASADIAGIESANFVPQSIKKYNVCSVPVMASSTKKEPFIPLGGDPTSIKNLKPYKIYVTLKGKHGSTKKNEHKMNKPTRHASNSEDIGVACYESISNNENEGMQVNDDFKSLEITGSGTDIAVISPDMDKVNELVKKLPKDAVISPLNIDLLNNPPSDFQNKDKIYMTPKPHGVPTSKHSSIKYTELVRKTYKEPKFVPYEPYKGCSDPILKNKSLKKSQSLQKEFALTSQPTLLDISSTPRSNGQHNRDYKKACAKLDIAVNDFEAERMQWDQRVKELTDRCEQADQALAKCQREKTMLEDQLNVQAQVNSELKKLLVASVGEDVQGRVHCLTEDKARMATMIRRYSEKLDRDYEERERMGILCDVWKSKFLASSVLVEELGSWKASLLRWTTEAAEALTVLLEELRLVSTNTCRTHRLVSQLVTAFDPLHAESLSSPTGVTLGSDGVSLSLAVAERSQALHRRLLGTLLPPPPPAGGLREQNTQGGEECTPGEKMAMQVLSRRDSCVGLPGYAGGAAGPRVPPHHPLHSAIATLPSHMTVNCCAHCNGEIQLV